MFIDSTGYSDLVNSSGMTDMISQTNCSFCDKSFPFPSFVDILPSAKTILEKSSYITTESLNAKKLSISVVAAMTVTWLWSCFQKEANNGESHEDPLFFHSVPAAGDELEGGKSELFCPQNCHKLPLTATNVGREGVTLYSLQLLGGCRNDCTQGSEPKLSLTLLSTSFTVNDTNVSLFLSDQLVCSTGMLSQDARRIS